MTSPISPELQSRIADWRLRCAEGTMTREDYIEAIVHLRAGRLSAAQAASAARKKPGVVASAALADATLDELDSI